jgi:hypothetical protein
MRQGVGALRVDRAVALTSYASPAGVSFGRLNPLTQITRTQRVRLKNLGNARRSFSVAHVAHNTYPGHTAISIWVFVSVSVGALFITLATVSFQTIRAAVVNPISSLRSE